MKTNKINTKELNKLERHVYNWIKERAKEYESGAEGVIKDLMYGGCASGIVGHLIYYNDTLKFYKKYQKEISALLTELIDSTGLDIQELFGDKFDKADPLCLDTQNQNLLAWVGFEETARNIANKLGLDV